MSEQTYAEDRREGPTNQALADLLNVTLGELREHRKVARVAHAELVELINSEITKQVPINHLALHSAISEHLSHSPEPKIHGEHHAFTNSVQENFKGVVAGMMKSLGWVILLAIGIGLVVGSDNLRNTYQPKAEQTTQ